MIITLQTDATAATAAANPNVAAAVRGRVTRTTSQPNPRNSPSDASPASP